MLESRGVKCHMLGLTRKHPSGTFTMRNLKIGEIIPRRGVTWHLEMPQDKETSQEHEKKGAHLFDRRG